MNYQRKREAAARRSREEAAEGKDLGELPRVKNRRRRAACEQDLALFEKTYFPETFPWEWSEDHRQTLARMQTIITDSGLCALAAPRGDGKSSKILRACIWAVLYGYRSFIVLIGSEQEKAEEDLLSPLKMEFETNKLLLEDFPEVVYPIVKLDGQNNRCSGQTINGQRTHIAWKGRQLVFPTVKGSRASGATVRVCGLLGRIRGMSYTTATGKTIRPDLVLIDDPQTDLSAKSDTQCATREKILSGAVMGLAGPGKRINGFAAVTVIREGDLADRLLNRTLYPRWHGHRYKLVYAWPTNESLLEQYLNLRSDDIAAGDDKATKATAFWRRNRVKIEAGAKVGWEARKEPHEVSAIQHAVNLRQDNPDSFDAEYQNEPRLSAEGAETLRLPTSDQVLLQQSGYARGVVPDGCHWITSGWDVQGDLLVWAVTAFAEDFSAWLIDYGTWPEQGNDYWSVSELEYGIQAATKIVHPGAAIRAALAALGEELGAKRYRRVDGAELAIDRFHVDSGYQTESVYAWCRQSSLPVFAIKGEGVTAKMKPWSTRKRVRGERAGFGWRQPPVAKTAAPRYVLIDTNLWKAEILPRWTMPIDAPGAWSVFKAPHMRHRVLGDHLASEFATLTSGRGRSLYEFTQRPGRENHLLDCVLYAAVAANMLGARLPQDVIQATGTRRASSGRSLAEMRAAAGNTAPMEKSRPTLAELRAAKRRSA